MDTKQGYIDPQMPFPYDIRNYKATRAEILAIPEGARYKGMEIYAYDEAVTYIFRNGVTDSDLEASSSEASGLTTAVSNTTGALISRGKVLHRDGDFLNLPAVELADNTNNAKLGSALAYTDIPDGGQGGAFFDGVLGGFDTTAWLTNDDLYYDATGDLTKTKPIAGFDTPIGRVLVGGVSDGTIALDFRSPVDEGGGGEGGPAIENRYGTLANMYGDQINQADGGLQFVADASADPAIETGYAYYEYLGTTAGDLTDYRLSSDGHTHANKSILDATTESFTAADQADIDANTTHRSSDGTDHSDVVLNNTHRGSDGTDHANVVLNDTHRGSDGKDHSDVVLNNTHRTGDGSDHADVAANTLKVSADGSVDTHSDVDITTSTPSEGDALVWETDKFVPGQAGSPLEILQSVTITNANATDALALDVDANVIEITLDAALTQDWVPSAITGIVVNRNYTWVILKVSDNGVDMTATTGAFFDDDIDPFANLIDITTTQQRAVVPAVGLKSTAIQFAAMILTGSAYAE